MYKNFNKPISVLAVISLFFSFWIFSRFTVDDAFISWRYGMNFVGSGFWNYNPSAFDMTQAYTNPIFAMLSIFPAFFGVDMVLFFKIVSIFVFIGFYFPFLYKARSPIMTTFFLAIPASVVHIFSGLETFLFVALFVWLVIFLIERKAVRAIFFTCLLFLTRPEAWLLLFLTPICIFLQAVERNKVVGRRGFDLIDAGGLFKATSIFSALLVFLGIYFYFHYSYFGFALPNTFYVKSGSSFDPVFLATFFFFLLPVFYILLMKEYSVLLIVSVFLSAMALKYSISDLQMNYAQRFIYHGFAISFFLAIYAISNAEDKNLRILIDDVSIRFLDGLNVKLVYFASLLVPVILFSLMSTGSALSLVSYYPRALDSHSALGKRLYDLQNSDDSLRSFSFGDAGMAAFHSGLISLDNIGLGSSLIAHQGVNDKTISMYAPDVIVFHSTPEYGIRLSEYGQKSLYEYAVRNRFEEICDIYWKKDYTLKIYAKKNYDFYSLCRKSKSLNNVSEKYYLFKTLFFPPYRYWHE